MRPSKISLRTEKNGRRGKGEEEAIGGNAVQDF